MLHDAGDRSENMTPAHSPIARFSRPNFGLLAVTMFAGPFAGNIPTPLFVIYQQRLHFSESVVASIFSANTVATALALLFGGRLSDHLGRRTVLIPATALGILGGVIFLLTQNVIELMIARFVTALMIGTFMPVVTAALTEAEPKGDRRRAATVATIAISAGFGLGPLMAGAFAQWTQFGLTAPYLVQVLVLLAALPGILSLPKTKIRRLTAGSFRPARFGLVPNNRSQFRFAAFSIGCGMSGIGIFVALGPSLMQAELHSTDPAVDGFVIFLVLGASALTQFVGQGLSGRAPISLGLVLIAIGLGFTVAAAPLHILAVLFVGAALVGAGQGLSFMGSVRETNLFAPAESRGEVVSTVLLVGQVAVFVVVMTLGETIDATDALVGVAVVGGAVSLTALAGALLARRVPLPRFPLPERTFGTAPD